ncbi:MAG: ABC-2 type transport system ATP-binding protein [Paraglaciecola sp.]
MISVKNLFKSFNGFQAVNDLSFDIIPGDVVGFLGPNGAGKSTIMKMLTGFLLFTNGDINISDLSFKHSALEIKKIGYLPQSAPAYGDMTPLQFLNFIA